MEFSGSVHSRMNVILNYIHLSPGSLGKREVSEWYRMTAEALNECNKRHLAQLAKEKGITGWHAMRKDQLIRALSNSRSAPAKSHKKKKVLQAAVAARRKKT